MNLPPQFRNAIRTKQADWKSTQMAASTTECRRPPGRDSTCACGYTRKQLQLYQGQHMCMRTVCTRKQLQLQLQLHRIKVQTKSRVRGCAMAAKLRFLLTPNC